MQLDKQFVDPSSSIYHPKVFPFRLHDLLSQAERLGFEDIVSWDESGTKLLIHNHKKFVSKILPNAFRQSSFASFRRQMSAYGFVRESKEVNKSKVLVYSNKFFRRDDIDKCWGISRRKRPNKRKAFYIGPSFYSSSNSGKLQFDSGALTLSFATPSLCFPMICQSTPIVKRSNDAAKNVSEQNYSSSISDENTKITKGDAVLDKLAMMVRLNSSLPNSSDAGDIKWDPNNESLSSMPLFFKDSLSKSESLCSMMSLSSLV
eukprot:CAMPEP_0194213660 /NCGR_PEP_ID=MMETSP0156-20130528/14404_1 /TAXON_ID=33649 /ORGANISM="Thalassionema nitzschioides, Strain L26-B" /LENGTH=260 /DNA_ID=CAMNT_0038941741 /DNA_START=311 /DNA_END=1089 /DNA_ORIENTATION=-